MSSLTPENRRAVYAACVSMSGELYKTIATIATTFLGGGLYYVEKFVDMKALASTRWHNPAIILLSSGFLFLVTCVAVGIWSQRVTLAGGNATIDDGCSNDRVNRLFKKSDRLLNLANALLIMGMFSIMLFGVMNIFLLKGVTNGK